MTVGQSIDYDGLTQQALRGVVRTILVQIAKTGLPGDHHFFIAFDTRSPGVVMSRRLMEKYPEEMMIVLQHRFWDLSVGDDRFEVKLTFDGIPERLVVPFTAIKLFFDPSVRYTLQFEDAAAASDDGDTADRRRPRDVEDTRPQRRPMRPELVEDSSEPTPFPAPAAVPAPAPAAQTHRSADPAPPAATAEPVTPADTSDNAATEPNAPVVPAASPAGAKIVSIDSWRNRK